MSFYSYQLWRHHVINLRETSLLLLVLNYGTLHNEDVLETKRLHVRRDGAVVPIATPLSYISPAGW